MKSKSLIEKQLRKKTNPKIVETIIAAKKKKDWVAIAGMISRGRKKQAIINLSDINKQSKEGENVLVPGKVLSQGEIKKKVKVIALNFSEKAKEKLKNSGCEFSGILKEIKSNPEAKGLHILTGKEK
jgi:large subunit ribosomal protein L18e